MPEEKWTISDKPTQIISLFILILGGLVVVSVLYWIIINNFSNIPWFWILLFFVFCLFIILLKIFFSYKKKNKSYKWAIVAVILITIIVFYYLYNIHFFEDYYLLDDGTKVQGDIVSIEVINYTVYTTGETDYNYENLGEGFIHNNKATSYYVSVHLKANTFDKIKEKKLTVYFLDKNGFILDSSWIELSGFSFNHTSKITTRPFILRIYKDSMGNNFNKAEKVSFRISESVDSIDNWCNRWLSTTYHDERFFGTWLNESVEVNNTCADLFREYSFYSNGTGISPHGKFYWETIIDHRLDCSYVEMNIYDIKNLVDKNNMKWYEANLYFEFNNNNQTVNFDNVLRRSGFDYCYDSDYSLDYSKQRDHT